MIEKIKEIIAEQANLKDKNSLTMETNLQEELGLDSLDAVEIIMQLEEEFDIQVPDEAFFEVKTIWDIAYYIEKAINWWG